MLCETARLDLAALRSAGYSPTDAEVVQLNDIGVRIERGKERTPANMPRMAWAGKTVLHEPTVGAIMWWHDYGLRAASSDAMRLMTHYWMLAHADDPDELNSHRDPKDIVKTVRAWMRGLDCTHDELWRACVWVKYGEAGRWESDSPDAERIRTSIDNEADMEALWTNVIAAAGALGVVPDELRTSTQSALVAMLVQANLMAHNKMTVSIASDYIKYRQLMRTIEERGTTNG